MEKLNQENTNFNKIDMNAQEARKIAEEIKITPEIEDTIGEIKKAAMLGNFSIYKDTLSEPARNHLNKLGYSVKWFDIQRDGYWQISW
jgi:hypothetical protein